MKNIWVRFGCFLTGYNYNILRGCSEAAFKSVKKYTAAMLIICILWFLIGFTFAGRYLSVSISGRILAGLVAVIIIVQVERQIILTIHPGKLLQLSRFFLALMMSILGAVVIDQILFEKDIELEKISYVSEQATILLPDKTKELEKQIADMDTTINRKEQEKQQLILDVGKHPTIPVITTQTQSVIVPTRVSTNAGNDTIIHRRQDNNTVIRGSMPNPRIGLIQPLDSTIGSMRMQKAAKENELLHARPDLEQHIMSKTGFLDELKVMMRLISKSYVALCFWLLWIIFILFIELLVLFSKLGDKGNDYDKAVLHHMNLRIQRLEALARSASPA